jgi:hypothetical protein
LQDGTKEYVSTDAGLDTMLSTANQKTATLALLNSLHRAFVLSSETERLMILGQVDSAYQNIGALESAVEELRGKNASLAVLSTLTERVGILKDVLGVETERLWSSLVVFSEEGDIQLTVYQKRIPAVWIGG